jgi:hypothetical protein
VLRIEVSEEGQGALPAIDVDDAVVVIGSGAAARVRLPVRDAAAGGPSARGAVATEHVRVEAGRWYALGPVRVDGVPRDAGDTGDIGGVVTLELGAYRVRIAPAPSDAPASTVQRTESLARELMRNLLGTAGAPTLAIERGAHAGAERPLAPPESTLIIGRGDEAGWIIADKDLSRMHAEIRRGWDGTRIVDLGSKNGTQVDGDRVGPEGMALRDGCVIELGPIVMRFRDPAERQLQGEAPALRALAAAEQRVAAARRGKAPTDELARAGPASRSSTRSSIPSRSVRRGNPIIFYTALAIMIAALAGLVWVLAS